MGETAYGWLSRLNSVWTPSATQFAGARSHRASIEGRLDSELGIFGMFEIGSLRHGTGIWIYSDADYLASMKGSRPESPWTTLNKVKEALQGRFPKTFVAVRRPAVVCHFSDGVVEIVPGFNSGSGYWIADPTGGWMQTFPEDHNKWVNEVNNRHNGAVKTLARQLKIWKYKRRVPISSCYLEMRTAKYMDSRNSYAAVGNIHGVLKSMQDAGIAAMNDPTGLGSRFTACSSDSTKADSLSKLGTAVTRAEKAREFVIKGDHAEAIAQLKLLFDA